MSVSEIFENYYGCNLSTEEYDRIALEAQIAPKYLKREKGLKSTCWFDYYHLHPVEATYLFVHYYTKIYKRANARRLDYTSAPFINPFKGKTENIFEKGKTSISGIWRARQVADEYGIPYELFCIYAFQTTEEHIWQRLPRPQHLFTKKILQGVIEKFDRERRARILVPKHSDYLLRYNREFPNQNRCVDWLIDHITGKANPEFSLAYFLFEKPMLSTQHLSDAGIGSEVVKQAYDFYHEK